MIEPHNSSSEKNNTDQTVLPTVIYGEGLAPDISISPQQAAETMRELGISDFGISEAVIYADPKNRLQVFGTHYPNWTGRQRFNSIPEIRESKGDIIRLSTKMKGRPRTAKEMNITLVHELEHLAQEDRKDRKVTEGHIAIWGLALAGAVVGNRFGKSSVSRTIGTLFGAGAGHSLGYLIAPHERQARRRAGQGHKTAQVTSTAVER